MTSTKDRLLRVMIIGATPAGIFAANKLGELGVPVTLVDSDPDLDKKMSAFRLTSGLPLNHAHRPGLIRILRNPSIRCILPARVDGIKHSIQGFRVKLTRQQTFFDPERCTLCGACVEACPVTLDRDQKPIRAHSRQSLPGRPFIDKRMTPLCKRNCPLGVNVQGYMALTAQKKFKEALSLIRRENILPGICGRICTHPCETECRRNEMEGAVSIRSVKRFLADELMDEPADDLTDFPAVSPEFADKKFAVIGSGPAGIASAWELVKHGCRVTVFEREKMAGGLLRYGIGPHRLPREILDRELALIQKAGVRFETGRPVDLTSGLAELAHDHDGVIIATGAWKDRRLNIPGEALDGVAGCIAYLRDYYNGDVTKTASSVAVIGDGNAAFDLARVLRRQGADVTLISWFSQAAIPADKEEIEGALREGVTILDNTSVVEFKGKNNRLDHLVCKATRPGKKADANGMVWPELVEKSPEKKLDFKQAFVAIGQTGPLAPGAGPLKVNRAGFIDTRDQATSMDAVFAAGDAASGPSSVVHAMAQGKAAARKALETIRGAALDSASDPLRPRDKAFDPVPGDAPAVPRTASPLTWPKTLAHDFSEINQGMSADQAISEAGRCLQCGACSECLVCQSVCPAHAVNHTEAEEEMTEHTGALILADPDMLPHPIKGVDIIRAYGPGSTRPDPHAMMLRGFASAAQAMTLLKNRSRRRKGHGVYFTAPDPAVDTQDIRIGVFVCRCNDASGWHPDMDAFLAGVNDAEPVVHAGTVSSACVKEGMSDILKTVRARSVNRIVLASCVCCPLNFVCTSCTDQRSRLKQALFTGTGISRAMVETCNIRGEALNLLKHDPVGDPDQALARFKGLITRSVKRAQHLKPFSTPVRNYNFTTGVIGESEASVTSAMMLAETGAEVMMFGSEKYPLSRDPGHPNIHAFLGARATQMAGTLGDFQITAILNGESHIFHVGAVIVEDKLLKQIRHILQEGLPDRTVLTRMQEKDIPGRPFLLPGMTSISGLFLSNPQGIRVSARQKGAAAAIHVAAAMPRRPRQSKGYTVAVDPQLCRGCGRCMEKCAYQAVSMDRNDLGGWTASVDEAFCKGCGNCIAVCPTNAVDSPYRDHVFLEQGLEEILL